MPFPLGSVRELVARCGDTWAMRRFFISSNPASPWLDSLASITVVASIKDAALMNKLADSGYDADQMSSYFRAHRRRRMAGI